MKYLAKSSMLLKIAVLCLLALCASSVVQAQDFKIGYIDSQRIRNEARPYKDASAKLEQEFGKRAADLRDMEDRLKSMQAKMEKDESVMSPADRGKGQRDLAELYKEYQRKKREFQEDVSQRQNEERESSFGRVNKVIAQIAEAEKYDIVLTDALYVSNRIDITDKVLKILNKP